MPHYPSSRSDITPSIVTSPLTLAIASLLAATGCGSTTTTPPTTKDGSAPPDATTMMAPDMTAPPADMAMAACTGAETFGEAHAAMLNSCGGKNSCHIAQPLGAGLDLNRANAYKSLVGVTAAVAKKTLVKPGDPDGSFLFQKVTNTQGAMEGLPMPRPSGTPWEAPDPARLQVLRCWIRNGAKNN